MGSAGRSTDSVVALWDEAGPQRWAGEPGSGVSTMQRPRVPPEATVDAGCPAYHEAQAAQPIEADSIAESRRRPAAHKGLGTDTVPKSRRLGSERAPGRAARSSAGTHSGGCMWVHAVGHPNGATSPRMALRGPSPTAARLTLTGTLVLAYYAHD